MGERGGGGYMTRTCWLDWVRGVLQLYAGTDVVVHSQSEFYL